MILESHRTGKPLYSLCYDVVSFDGSVQTGERSAVLEVLKDCYSEFLHDGLEAACKSDMY